MQPQESHNWRYKMNGSTHRQITAKAIEFLMKELGTDFAINGKMLSDHSGAIQEQNSATDRFKDFEFVDVEGHYNTGRDNPHKDDSNAVDDEANNSSYLGHEYTSFNHFIDIKKGPGIFDDYDGYSYAYGSASHEQHEEVFCHLVDKVVMNWVNDEYVHIPGSEYYQNCSPAAWNYSFPDGLNKHHDKYSELKNRFPLATYMGGTGKGIPYSVMMPVDNLGRFWYETFILSGDLVDLGPALHAIQDASVPHHATGYLGNDHVAYENALESYFNDFANTTEFREKTLSLFCQWHKSEGSVPLTMIYEDDYDKVPNTSWRIDMLITWVAFRAYRAYSDTYGGFSSFSGIKKENAQELLTTACAMSMLMLVKAKAEFEASIPPDHRRVRKISVSHHTADEKNANTDSDFNLYLYNNYCGGSIYMPFPDLEHDERECGATDEYTFNVGEYNIDAEKFKIGIGVLNQDSWLPDSFTIKYDTFDGITHIYAYNLPWNDWFDDYFWHAIIKKTFSGGKEKIGKIIITTTTSTKIHAETKGSIVLRIKIGDYEQGFPFKSLPWGNGAENTDVFDLSAYELPAEGFILSIVNKSMDGWHPQSIILTVENDKGGIIVSESIKWKNNKWFEKSELSKPEHIIYNGVSGKTLNP